MRVIAKACRTRLGLPQINDQDPRWDFLKSTVSTDSLLNAYINLAKVKLKADATVGLAREKMAGMLVETFQDDSGIDYAQSTNVVVANGALSTQGTLDDSKQPVYSETTQADFQQGILENVVATEAGDLELLLNPVLLDDCSNISAWTTGGQGQALSDGNSFYALDYGSGTNWHGPTLTRDLALSLSNFECEIDVTITNTGSDGYEGKILVELLDDVGNVVAHFYLGDFWTVFQDTITEAFVEGSIICSVRSSELNNYSGSLRLMKCNETWSFYTGTTLRGTLNKAVASEIRKIRLSFQAYSSNTPCPVLKINNVQIVEFSQLTGSRISPAISFPTTETAAGVTVDWDATSPSGTSISIETSIDNGNTWQGVAEGQDITSEIGIKFDGVDDFIDFLSAPLEGPGDFTIEVKLKTTQASSSFDIVQQRDPSSVNGEYEVQIINGKIRFYVYNGGYQFDLTGSINVADGISHYIVAQRKNNNGYIYVDGVLDASSLGASSKNVTKLHFAIGKDYRDNRYHFNGVIYEVRIWNYARTQAEIQADMNRQLTGNEPGLIGYWKFNEGSGITVYDSTANGNHGTISGGAVWERTLIAGDMAGKSLLLRQKLSTTDPSVTPQLHSITVFKDASIKFVDDFNLPDGSAPDGNKWISSSELSSPDIKVLNGALQIKTTATSVNWSTAQVRSISSLNLTPIIKLTYRVTPDHGSLYKGSHMWLCPTAVTGIVWYEPNWIRVGFENNTFYIQRKTNGTVTALLQTTWSYTGATYNMDILIAGSRLIVKVDGAVKYDDLHGLNFTQAYLYLASHCSQNLTCTTSYDDVLVKQIIPDAVPNGSMDSWKSTGLVTTNPNTAITGKLVDWTNAHINGGTVDDGSYLPGSTYHIKSAHVRANGAGDTSSKGVIISKPFVLGASISYMAKREEATYAIGSFEVLDAVTDTVLYSVDHNAWTASWAEYTIDTSANIGRLAKVKLTGGTSYQGQGYGIFFDNIIVRPATSYGRTYTLANPPSTSYPDTNNRELTDGVFETPGSYLNPNWVGIRNADFIVTLDLGDVFDITGVLVYAASATISGIYYPNTINVYISLDGVNFSLARSFDTSWKAEYSNINTEGTKFFIEFPKVSGRYVKLQMTRGGEWTFVSEIEVFIQRTTISLPGTYISIPESINITPVKVALMANDSGNVAYYVSRDGGATWTEAPKDTIVDLSSQPVGQSLAVKANLQPGAVIAGLVCIWGV